MRKTTSLRSHLKTGLAYTYIIYIGHDIRAVCLEPREW